MSAKRSRSASPASSPSTTPKALRTTPLPEEPGSSSMASLLCTLPPTCHRHPTSLAGTKDLEAHYATYHTHVCELKGCLCVFPDARLLELHQTECHDPLAAVRKERGEKIFACHLASCERSFLSPKARRLHLINAHGYPKEYFFAITNKGVGGLLKKWGEGASLIRGEWKARESQESPVKPESDEEDKDDSMDSEDSDSDTPPTPRRNPPSRPRAVSQNTVSSLTSDSSVDSLANEMGSLRLVPASIRFGRGGKKSGFENPEHRNAYLPTHGVRGARGRAKVIKKEGAGMGVEKRALVDGGRGKGRGL